MDSVEETTAVLCRCGEPIAIRGLDWDVCTDGEEHTNYSIELLHLGMRIGVIYEHEWKWATPAEAAQTICNDAYSYTAEEYSKNGSPITGPCALTWKYAAHVAGLL